MPDDVIEEYDVAKPNYSVPVIQLANLYALERYTMESRFFLNLATVSLEVGRPGYANGFRCAFPAE